MVTSGRLGAGYAARVSRSDDPTCTSVGGEVAAETPLMVTRLAHFHSVSFGGSLRSVFVSAASMRTTS